MKNSNRAISVLVAGTLINISIGFLFAWSVFKKALVLSPELGGWGWTHSEANAAYTCSILVWSVAVFIGGLLQDAIGPKRVIQLGLALVGAGLFLSGFSQGPILMMGTLGGLAAIGVGLVYGPVTPMAMKWFSIKRKGTISGITVGGFGIAAAFYAPLANFLIKSYGISQTFFIFGIGIFVLAFPLTFIIDNPSKEQATDVESRAECVGHTWKQMIRTPKFFLIWPMFVLSASAGVMIIGHLTSIASKQVGIASAAYLVSVLAFSNAFGRVGGGSLSDKIGRENAIIFFFALQLVNMVSFNWYTTETLIAIGTIITGLSYGALMSIFPSLTADNWGLKHYGGNYGIIYMAWGASGIVGPILAGWARDTTDSYALAYSISAGLLGIAIALALGLRHLSLKTSTL